MKTFRATLAITLTMMAFSCPAQFAIRAYTINGGGGKSEGGPFTVQGTVGQPDAATPLTGGQFSVTPGFWASVSAIQTPGAPLLSIQVVGDSVQVSWPKTATAFTLEQSSAIPGNWQTVTFPHATNGSTVSVAVPLSGQIQVFRLRQ